MTIAAQLKALAAALETWAVSKGGHVEIAGDPFHLLALLQTKPGSVRVALLFVGENKRGDYEEASMVDRIFSVVISRGRGLTVKPSESLTEGQGDGQPLFDLVEEARQIVRGFSFDAATTEVTPNYTGCESFAVDGQRLDAYQLSFQIGTQLPEPEPVT